MAIFKPFLFVLLLLAAPGWIDAASPEQFLRNQHAPENILNKMLQGGESVKECLATDSKMLCVQGRKFPGSAKNTLSRQAITNGLGLGVKNDLVAALSMRIKASSLKNDKAASQVVIDAHNQGTLGLPGIEFQTFCRGDWCGAIASAPIKEAEQKLADIYQQKRFIIDYCKTLLPKAKELMAQGENGKALVALKELHDLKFADIEAYLLASKAFILDNKPDEAIKIAVELLDEFGQKLDANEAEELGDLFVSLNMPDQAVASYEIANDRIE